jgi:hypothetical protein
MKLTKIETEILKIIKIWDDDDDASSIDVLIKIRDLINEKGLDAKVGCQDEISSFDELKKLWVNSTMKKVPGGQQL